MDAWRAGSRLGRLARRVCSLAVVLAVLVPALLVAGCSGGSANPVVVENRRTGTTDWKIGRPGFIPSDDLHRQVEGYASATSVAQGGRIDLHVSVDYAQLVTAEVYRMGWYGGRGGRLVKKLEPIAAAPQPACRPAEITGLTDCAWPAAATVEVAANWTSGIYLVLLTSAAKYQSYVTFVVRDDRRADFLYQQSVTTYQAYNNYPNDRRTGKSLYDFNSVGPPVAATTTARAAKVSFDRPYSDGYGSGQFAGNSGSWELYYLTWLERSGYDVTYSTDLDTHTNGGRLLDVKGFLSVGHDEYWSKPMMDAATQARDAGVNLGFFGSNTAYWQVRFERSAAGVDDRVMVCFKDARADPVQGATTTVAFRDPPVNRPEQSLVGIQYTAHLKDEGRGAPYVVQNSSHWVWADTGLTDGTELGGILGYETDRLMPNYPMPANTSFTILSRSPVVDASGVADYANSAIYQAPSGAWVFASGSNNWSLGLDKPGVVNRLVQQATQNILDRFRDGPAARPAAPPPPSALTAVALSSSVVDVGWTSRAGVDAGYTVARSGPGEADWVDLATDLPPGTLSYQDRTAGPSSQYRYRVRASGRGGVSAWSSAVAATTPTRPLFAETFSEPDESPWPVDRWSTKAAAGSIDIRADAGRMALGGEPAASVAATARMKPTTDSEVLALVDFPATSPRGFFYVFLRGTGDWDRGYPRQSYFLRLINDDSTIQLWRSNAGATTVLATKTGTPGGRGPQWVRFRVDGTTLSARVWSASQPEPTTWSLVKQDASLRQPGVLQLRWTPAGETRGLLPAMVDDVEVRQK